MKKVLLLIVLSIFAFSCNQQSKKELIFLNKNAYDYPVWQDMLTQDKVKFSDVILAFKAYRSNNIVDKETLEHFEKFEKRIKPTLDSDGYLFSESAKYKRLEAYRNATKNLDQQSTITNSLSSATSISFGVPNNASLGKWKNIGPFGDPDVKWSATGNGSLEHVEFHPTNPAEMYVSARNGGLWKTTNYGKNWTPMTDHFATDNVSCLSISKKDPTIFYMGAGEDKKVWYSSDSGSTWEDRSTGIAGTIYGLYSAPDDETKVLAATTEGIYLTTNSGTSWTQKVAGRYLDIRLTDNWDLIVATTDNNNDATGYKDFFFSKDEGVTFTEQTVTTAIDKINRFFLAIHKPTSGATQVFAYGIKNSNTPTTFVGLWKSDYTPNPADGTSFFSFTEVKHATYTYPNGAVPLIEDSSVAAGYKAETEDYYGGINPYSSAYYQSDFYVSPNNPDYMLTCREKIWGSEDGGKIWSYKPSYGGSHWADNRYFTTNKAKDSIFFCNDGGLWAIKDTDMFPSAATVTASGLSKNDYMASKVISKNGDICVAEGSQMDVSQLDKGVFMTGGQDLGQMFTRNGRTSHVASADVYRGRIKPTDDSKFITGRLNVKLDGSTDIHSVYDHIDADHFNSERLYGFTNTNQTTKLADVRLVRSPINKDGWLVDGFYGENRANTGGRDWTATNNDWETVNISSTGITDLKPGTFEQSKANGEIAFLGDEVGKKLFITENLSATTPTWVELTNAPKSTIYRLATHPYNENIIVAATSIGVYISKDKGQTWNVRANVPETKLKGVLIDKTTAEGIYVYTSLTVYYIDETRSEWKEFNKGLPLQNLTDMRIAYYANNDNRLYVSKYGRGVWSTSLQSVLDKNTNKPVADFAIHGLSKKTFSVGDTLKLISHASNATSLQWTIENGADVKNIADEEAPEAKLLNGGFYKVTLLATNANGSHTKIEENYIQVIAESTALSCTPTNSATLNWYRYLYKIKVDNDEYLNSEQDNYAKLDKVFTVEKGENIPIYIEDSHVDSNGNFNHYIKVWIDYNNDGDFDDANEEIATSGGRVENFTANFTVPSTALVGQKLNMRVVGLESSDAPISCQETGSRHVLDLGIIFKSKIVNSISHTLLTNNSVKLENNFTGANNIVKAGFVYSTLDTELTTENSHSILSSASLTNDDSFETDLIDLDYNRKYYYKAFIIDDSGKSYSERKSFQLAAFSMPSLECVAALNLDNNSWELKGVVYPNNNLFDELKIEYGVSDFSNSVTFDATSYATNKKFNIDTEITIDPANIYQYKVTGVLNGKSYSSNILTIDDNKTFCTPTADYNQWYRRIASVVFNGVTTNSSGSGDYEDFSSTIFKVSEGKTYPITITDSYSPGYDLGYVVYIDYNNDGDFDDSNEIALSGSDGESFTGNIVIPTEDIIFNTNLRMRVVGYTDFVTPCKAGVGQFEDYTINVVRNIWNGTTSTDWDVATNWSTGEVPTTGSNVIIPANVTNKPIASGAITLNKLTLLENASLTVQGAVTNTDIISIESGASFIAKESVSGVVKYTRFLPAKNKWYLAAPPVSNVDLEELIENTVFAKGTGTNIGIATYNTNSDSWSYSSTNSTGSLTSAEGYSMRLAGPGSVSFTGNMQTLNSLTIPIDNPGQGYNLIGNPYASYIPVNNSADSNYNLLKMNDADNDFLAETTLWFWDQSLNSGQGAYNALNHASSKRYVAPGQAFFVKANGNHNFIFSEDMQSHQETDVFNRSSEDRLEIELTVSDGTNSSKTEIYYINGTTTGWDNGYDSSIFNSSNSNLTVYTELVSDNNGEKLQIQSLPNSNYKEMVIPVSLKGKAGTSVTFKIDAINIPTDLNVILEDKELETFTILESTTNEYTVSLANDNLIDNRFYIHVNTPSILSSESFITENIKIFTINKNEKLRVTGIFNGLNTLKIFNVEGKQVYSSTFTGSGKNDIQLPILSSGVYVVNIINNVEGKKVSKKLLLQ
ncbi:T9SS type A sorting domain-containing protein [Polaribacter pectinis]|uniref:T9SS type A sorting domain-containing protein n=1 Tax=Polaribacter pectinis TaxID=2738844 RepID=A0A7G9LDK9_9FLAO|nr:GEVED domain-containing protein [Polaribacter pectinis]QNM86708.1 T9SS type A sorting domain-containing protein [Polaribacter pectinis]